jgi:hypothetical protein
MPVRSADWAKRGILNIRKRPVMSPHIFFIAEEFFMKNSNRGVTPTGVTKRNQDSVPGTANSEKSDI